VGTPERSTIQQMQETHGLHLIRKVLKDKALQGIHAINSNVFMLQEGMIVKTIMMDLLPEQPMPDNHGILLSR